MKNLAIFTQARINSKRCKNKMIRKFNKSTLLDIALSKLNSNHLGKYNVYLAAGEKKIVSQSKRYSNIKLINRNYKSLNSDKIHNVFNYFKNIEEDYLMFINPCSPFLKLTTIINAINVFQNNNYKSLTTVLKKKTWFFDHKTKPLNDNTNVNTKDLKPLFECTHNFHIFNKDYFIKNNKLWSNNKYDPYLYEVSFLESFDIDTEEEFNLFNKIRKIL